MTQGTVLPKEKQNTKINNNINIIERVSAKKGTGLANKYKNAFLYPLKISIRRRLGVDRLSRAGIQPLL